MVFPSTLIITTSSSAPPPELELIFRELGQLSSPHNPDIRQVDQQTGWGIETIRDLKNFLSQKPFSHSNLIVVIQQADQLNIESQNTLLKTLEEPGDNHYLILITSKPSSLLPTIISRCHKIISTSKNTTLAGKPQLQVAQTLSANLSLSEKLSADKLQFPVLVGQEIEACHLELITNPSLVLEKKLEKLILLSQMINANVDPRSALDYFLLR